MVGDKAEARTGPRNEPVSLRVLTRQLRPSGQQNSKELEGLCVECDTAELHNTVINIVNSTIKIRKENEFTGILSPAASFSMDR